MKGYLDCIPCTFRQALAASRIATDDTALHELILKKVAGQVQHVDMNNSPALIVKAAYDIIFEVTGVDDPYAEIKERTNEEAVRLLPEMERRIFSSKDPFLTAVRLAAAGNIIDMGPGHNFDIAKDVTAMLDTPLSVDETDSFIARLGEGTTVLYISDNAGEIVFDKPLIRMIQESGSELTLSVKSGPVINDATMKDAGAAGLTGIVKVIETGSADIGVNWARCSDEFLAFFNTADIVISKGQGNFETISGRSGKVFYLLKAKCHCIAKELGVRLGDVVFMRESGAGKTGG